MVTLIPKPVPESEGVQVVLYPFDRRLDLSEKPGWVIGALASKAIRLNVAEALSTSRSKLVTGLSVTVMTTICTPSVLGKLRTTSP
jgi:hypothetical protein